MMRQLSILFPTKDSMRYFLFLVSLNVYGKVTVKAVKNPV